MGRRGDKWLERSTNISRHSVRILASICPRRLKTRTFFPPRFVRKVMQSIFAKLLMPAVFALVVFAVSSDAYPPHLQKALVLSRPLLGE